MVDIWLDYSKCFWLQAQQVIAGHSVHRQIKSEF